MVLEIEVQGARQVRQAMPEAVAVFIAPPSREALRERLEARGTDTPEQVDAPAADRRARARGASTSSRTWWSTTELDRATDELARNRRHRSSPVANL